MDQVISFISGAREEFSRVTWPKREQAVRLAITVIIVSVVVGAFVGGLDFMFTNIANRLMGR